MHGLFARSHSGGIVDESRNERDEELNATMRNLEIKCPLPNRAETEARLARLGARRIWERRQKDTFYTASRNWLKLREAEGERAELISYGRTGPADGARTSDYDVLSIEDAAAWHRLLGRVLDVDLVVAKTRTLWRWEDTRIHLDRVDGLGEFLELETVVGDRPLDRARAETETVICTLGLAPETFISVRYRDLLAGDRDR